MPSGKRDRNGNVKGTPKPRKKKNVLNSKPRRPSGKKRASAGKRGELDKASRRFGETVSKRIKLAETLPEFEATPGIKKTGLDSLMNGDSIKADKQFNASFRGLGPNMDEFHSTASTREFVKGLLGDKGWADFDEEEQQYLAGLVDILSAIRVPTRFVGYSLDTGKMQHPTSRPEAFFEDPYATASKHAELDTARRNYVQRAADAAIEGGENARNIVVSAARAAIEFTLNNFMAPVSASNVQPHSKMATLEITDEKILEQGRWREFLKRYYTDVLGGKLRDADPKETKKTSRLRIWTPRSDLQMSAPPSPRRDMESGPIDEEEDKGQEIELDESGPFAPSFLDDELEESGLNIFGQSVTETSRTIPFEFEPGEWDPSSLTTSDFDLGSSFSSSGWKFDPPESDPFGSSYTPLSSGEDPPTFQFGTQDLLTQTDTSFGASNSFGPAISDVEMSEMGEMAIEQIAISFL